MMDPSADELDCEPVEDERGHDPSADELDCESVEDGRGRVASRIILHLRQV